MISSINFSFPDAAFSVIQNFYENNYFDWLQHPEQNLKLNQELIEMLNLGVFKITEFVTNKTLLQNKVFI